MSRRLVNRCVPLAVACLLVGACQSSSPSPTDVVPDASTGSPDDLEGNSPADPSTGLPSDTGEPMPDDADYTGSWMTVCRTIDPRRSETVRLSLEDGEYRLERYAYDGRECGAEEDIVFSQIETGRYEIMGPVEVPSGVRADSVLLTVRERTWDGEAVGIGDDQGYLDYFHRAGDTLFRAKSNRIGVAGFQFSEEIDFSIEYFLQRGE